MSNTQNIGDIIRSIVRGGEELYSEVCEVVSVDIDSNTAELRPISGKANILDVKMISGSSETPFLIIPKEESVVMCTYTSKDTAYVSLYSEIESVAIRGDQFGGLIKIDELVEQLGKLSARVDGIISAINNGVPVPMDGGLALQQSIKVGLASIVDVEDFTEMENSAVTHG